MNNPVAIIPDSLVASVAGNCGLQAGDLDIAGFRQTLARTVIKDQRATDEQVAAFLMVAKEYQLNPITKEIYAFPDKSGGIQPVVGIDGWLKIINSHPEFNGMEFIDQFDDSGKVLAVTCRMYRKDRDHATTCTEYLAECSRNTEPWKKWPARMLRHKAAIQTARYAFGFSGIVEPDEYEPGVEAGGFDAPAPETGRPEREIYSDEKFNKNLPAWADLIASGKKTPADIIKTVESRAALTAEQKQAIEDCAK